MWSNAWVGDIKKVLASRQMNIVKKVEVQKGGFSNESILQKSDKSNLIPRKNSWDTKKYGGLGSPNNGVSVLISHLIGKKQIRTKEIVGISIMEMQEFQNDPVEFLSSKEFVEPVVERLLPKYSLFEFEDGRRRLLASYKESQKGNQMVLPSELVTLLYHAAHYEKSEDSKTYIAKNKDSFEKVLDIVLPFATKNTLAEKKAKRIKEVYDTSDSTDAELCTAFINLMKFNEMKARAPFEFLGEKIPETRYRSTKELLKSRVIYQSITGLFESQLSLGE